MALTLISSATFHIRMTNRQSQSEQAQNLAESVLAVAMDRLADERDLGADSTDNSDQITVQYSPDAPVGRLTFHDALAQSWGVPRSVNNLGNDNPVVLPDGRSLPPFSAYLVAQAEYGGVKKTVESVIRIPLYKYALATSGSITSQGGLLVASIDEDTDLSQGLSAVPLEELNPGHIAAQSTSQSVLESISPSNGSLITGDVVAGGGVTVGTYTDVQGSVLQNHEPEELPDLEVTDYDPAGWAGLETINQNTLSPPSPFDPSLLEGLWRRQGDLTVLGDLELDGAYLYVDGSLQINGAVTGTGSIFSTGNISIGDASGFATDNVQALVADGDLSISGGSGSSARDNSFFSGILFNKGNMNLSNVTVVGSVVNHSNTNSTLQLNNVALLSNPEAIQFDFGLPGFSRDDFESSNSDYWYSFQPAGEDYGQFFRPEDGEFLTNGIGPDIPLRIYYRGGQGSDPNSLEGVYSSAQEIIDALEFFHDDQNTLYNLNLEISNFHGRFIDALTNANDLYLETQHESIPRGEFTLEPNQFVPFEDKVRVIWIRNL